MSCYSSQTGETALHQAASKGLAEVHCSHLSSLPPEQTRSTQPCLAQVTTCLLTAKSDVNAANKGQQTPLHKAAFEGHESIVAILLSVDR
jgi:ankyrin repeat protein